MVLFDPLSKGVVGVPLRSVPRHRSAPPQSRLIDELSYEILRGEIRAGVRARRPPPGELEDLEQEVFVALLQLEMEPRNAKLSTWISSVCGNKVIDHRRRERRRSSIQPEDASALLSSIDGPEDGLTAAETASWVYRALWLLPPTSRRVVYLRDIDGAGYAEIAAALGITAQAARAVITAA